MLLGTVKEKVYDREREARRVDMTLSSVRRMGRQEGRGAAD